MAVAVVEPLQVAAKLPPDVYPPKVTLLIFFLDAFPLFGGMVIVDKYNKSWKKIDLERVYWDDYYTTGRQWPGFL